MSKYLKTKAQLTCDVLITVVAALAWGLDSVNEGWETIQFDINIIYIYAYPAWNRSENWGYCRFGRRNWWGDLWCWMKSRQCHSIFSTGRARFGCWLPSMSILHARHGLISIRIDFDDLFWHSMLLLLLCLNELGFSFSIWFALEGRVYWWIIPWFNRWWVKEIRQINAYG